MLRIGIVGVDSTHTRANASILNGGQVDDARCVGLWGHDRAIASGLAQEFDIAQVVEQPQDLINIADAVMICDRYGEAHFTHALPFIEAGCPLFIDKPIADKLDQAQSLVKMANERGMLLMSGSSLRFTPVVQALKERLVSIEPLRTIVLSGPAEGAFPDPRARLLPFYGIHLTELMQEIMGSGVAWVRSSGKGRNEVASIAYRDGRMAIFNLLRDWRVGYHVSVFGQEGWDEAECSTNDYQAAYLGQMQKFLHMVRTGEKPIPSESTLEALETILAVDRSGQSGEIVRLTGA